MSVRVRTDHCRHCFGKTPMQTSRGVAHVAHEKSLRECAPGGAPPGDRKYQPGSALAQRLSQAAWQRQTEGTARRWSAKGEQTFVDQCRRAALGRKQTLTGSKVVGYLLNATKLRLREQRQAFRSKR
jgi:hypothetical protein